MRSETVMNMLAVIAAARDASVQGEHIARFGRKLFEAPKDAAALLEALAEVDRAGTEAEHMSRLLAAALDDARMARENGQGRGADFIAGLEAQLEKIFTKAPGLTGRLVLSGTWVRAGLAPPDCLARGRGDDADVPLAGDPGDIEAILEGLLGTVISESGGSVSAMHAMFAEMLPTVPVEAREMLVRIAVGRPPEVFADLGCAWLLDAGEALRRGALAGLSDRLAAGRLSGATLARLTLLRSWLADAALRDGLDDLIRAAMRKEIGASTPKPDPEPKLHRIVASFVDGSGAQSLAAAVQVGGARLVAVVLLKQGFGVKDAYVVRCESATEQRGLLDRITHEIEAREVARAYLAEAIGLAISEGLERGLSPVPGLVEVVQVCGLSGLRPIPASVLSILELADPEGHVAVLSVQARGRLITSSEFWEEDYPMLASWFEDGDETVAALAGAKSRAGLNRAMGKVLEARRDHWARIIARNAHLLRAAGADDAEAFVAVAAAMAAGRDLKKIPAMQSVCALSIEVWLDRMEDIDAEVDADLAGPGLSRGAPMSRAMPDISAEKKGEMARLLAPAGLSEPWLDGYLTGVCTAPHFVSPPDWLGPLLHVAGEALTSEATMQRVIALAMLRYNACLSCLEDMQSTGVPADPLLLPIWADGYLTAWEATKSHWPAKALGAEGKAMRKALEHATEGRIGPDFATRLNAWLQARFAAQQM